LTNEKGILSILFFELAERSLPSGLQAHEACGLEAGS
jgi:hypothetical protein